MPKLEIGGSYFKNQCATSHSTFVAAFGDLSDNARDAGAEDVWIDVKRDKKGKPLIDVWDNGPGADPKDLLRIISVSRSNKNKPMQACSSASINDEACIGGFGFGLKGGIFKVGESGLVITVQGNRAAAALLSIPYNENKEHASSPCVVWVIRSDGSLVLDVDVSWADKGYDSKAEEEEIITHGPFKNRKELYDAITEIGDSGFRVVISDIKEGAMRVEGDTIIFEGSENKTNPSIKRPRKDLQQQQQQAANEDLKEPLTDDLRVFLSQLYLPSKNKKLDIHLLGTKVKPVDPYSLLVTHRKRYDKYLLNLEGEDKVGKWPWSITLGFWTKGTEKKKKFGLSMYKGGRLVEYYKRYGIMDGRGGFGNWIQGVVEVPDVVEHVLTKDRFNKTDSLDKMVNQIKLVVSAWNSEFNQIKKQAIEGGAGAGAGLGQAGGQGKAMGAKAVAKGGMGGMGAKAVAKGGSKGAATSSKKRKADLKDDDEEEDNGGSNNIDPPSTISIPPPAAQKKSPNPSGACPAADLALGTTKPFVITLDPPSSSRASIRAKDATTQTDALYPSSAEAAAVDNGAGSRIRELEQQVQLLLKASADQMVRGNVLETEKIRLEIELDGFKNKIKDNNLQCFFGGTPAKN